MSNNDHDLERFIDAQEGKYETAVSELKRGAKETHWMWFIFPQIEGLGSSDMAKRYAIKGIEEAEQYLNHPILGSRLLQCAKIVLSINDRFISDVFRFPDDLKLKSSMTLFAHVHEADPVFEQVLDEHFQRERDDTTEYLLLD